jgi:hypothetical protein
MLKVIARRGDLADHAADIFALFALRQSIASES